MASPQQPRLAAPAPSLPSAAVASAATRPQLQLQFVQQSGTLHAIPVPAQAAGTGPAPGRLSFPSVAQQITNAASSPTNQQNATTAGSGSFI